ncbi:MAG: hypothetical protein ACO3JL_18075, partial [Myxococcota bacterium]
MESAAVVRVRVCHTPELHRALLWLWLLLLGGGREVFAPIASNCAVDDDCGNAGYCEKGYCVARCTLDDHCAADQVCGQSGRCQRMPRAADKGDSAGSGIILPAQDAGDDGGSDVDGDGGTIGDDEDGGSLDQDAGDVESIDPHENDVEEPGLNDAGTPSVAPGDGGVQPAPATDGGETAIDDGQEVPIEDETLPEAPPPPVPNIDTFLASPSAVNIGGTVTLSWQARDAETCRLQSRTPGEAGWLSESVIVFGAISSHSLNVYSTREYRVSCTGAGGTATSDVTVDAARAYLTSPSPALLGIEPELVTVGYSYTGPGTCTTTPADEDETTDGIQLTLGAETTVTLTCDGYGSPLVHSLVVPQLLISFVGPDMPVPYGESVSFSWRLGVA